MKEFEFQQTLLSINAQHKALIDSEFKYADENRKDYYVKAQQDSYETLHTSLACLLEQMAMQKVNLPTVFLNQVKNLRKKIFAKCGDEYKSSYTNYLESRRNNKGQITSQPLGQNPNTSKKQRIGFYVEEAEDLEQN